MAVGLSVVLEGEMITWDNCYNDSWKGIIIDEAMSHPAKFARGLITRIIKHALENGYIQPGGVVVDPFGGQAGGALPAMQAELNWVGCELEPRFVELGNRNIELWNQRYAPHFPKWGSAVLLQGDSRHLAEVIGAAGIVVSSPPFSESGSQPPNTGGSRPVRSRWKDQPERQDGYGSSPGKLGAMSPGQPPVIVTSPPFAGNTGGRGEASRNGIDAALFDRHSGGMKKGTGSDPANLDHLPMGKIVVGSPPYEGTRFDGGEDSLKKPQGHSKGYSKNGGYAENSPNQLGNSTGETFWSAARLILDQCALILPPGAYAIWVVKAYVKNGTIVDFPGQWQALCEACVFETVEVIQASLVKRNGSQAAMDGGAVSKDVARKSFFRRLHERKRPDLAIDFETVLITRRVQR